VIQSQLEERVRTAFAVALPETPVDEVIVRPCADPKFGDYQCISVMPLAKQLKTNPRELAAQLVAALDVSDLCDKAEIAGPGFVNFHVKTSGIESICRSAARGEHLFFDKVANPRTIVIDFSSPNVAKPMHVGHIRSTILGDCLARMFRLLGHNVITDNHIGDWGTQFGMLLVGWKKHMDAAALELDPIAELERVYKHVNALCNSDESVRESARAELVRLQAGDEENLEIWNRMIALSQVQFDDIYGRLGVEFDHIYGESHYNDQLPGTVDSLMEQGVARESEGAIGVFTDGSLPPKQDPFLTNKDGEWIDIPALIRKKDGGFNYATTDLATLEYRAKTWSPDEIVYVTDGRQQQHFQQVFRAYRRWRGDGGATLAHVWFGSILGADKKPLKTREGSNVRLADLLNEAEERAFKIVDDKNAELTEEAKREIARVVGLGAVKYADLLPHRQSDYIFDWDKMLSFSGNAAPYLQMSYTRIRSIFRKTAAAGHDASVDPELLQLLEDSEIGLAKKLLGFGMTLNAVGEDYRPNLLCNYLFELSGMFSKFFEQCPVIKSEDTIRRSRLVLCDLTARVLKQGLDILGIETTEIM
jgi:arginyl-tRNA synthetase